MSKDSDSSKDSAGFSDLTDTVMNLQTTHINEIEGAFVSGSADRRADMLHKITDLFVGGAVTYSADQIGLFDAVLTRLANDIEISVRAELAHRICDAAAARPTLLRKLADDRIDQMP